MRAALRPAIDLAALVDRRHGNHRRITGRIGYLRPRTTVPCRGQHNCPLRTRQPLQSRLKRYIGRPGERQVDHLDLSF